GGPHERPRMALGVCRPGKEPAVKTCHGLSGRNNHGRRQVRRRRRMIRVALDSNILIYAELEPESDKGARSADLILRAAPDGVIPAQVLGEYLRFVQRRAPAAFRDAMRQAAIYQTIFLTPPTTSAIINKASELAQAHGLQLWDCVVCAASAQAGATVLM